MKVSVALLGFGLFFLGFRNYELSKEVSALKARVDWTDKFMSKHEVDVKTGIHELNILSDKIINTIVELDKRLKVVENK